MTLCVSIGTSHERRRKMTDNNMIEMTLAEYNTFMLRSLKYDLLKKAIAKKIKAYKEGGGVYIDNDILDVYRLLCPYEYDRRVKELKEGEAE